MAPTEDPASLFSLEAKANPRRPSPPVSSASAGPSTTAGPSFPSVRTSTQLDFDFFSKKPALPRLQVGQAEPGGPSSASPLPGQTQTQTQTAAVRSATSTPTLPKHKVPAFLEKPPLHVKTDILASTSAGSGLSTKQRLAQTAMQITTPTEKVSEPSRPLPPQKNSSLSGTLSGMNFKKRPPNVRASPTITPAEMTPLVPVYSPPPDVPAAAAPTSSSSFPSVGSSSLPSLPHLKEVAPSSSSSSFPSVGSSGLPSLPSLPHLKEVDLPASVSRKRKWSTDVDTQGRPHPHKLQSSSMNEVQFEPLRRESEDINMTPPAELNTPTPAQKKFVISKVNIVFLLLMLV